MRERIFIYDRSGNLINDPERSVDYASSLRWQTTYPGGYGTASFSVSRDIAQTWAIKNGYEIIVRDGAKIVYQGELTDINRALTQTDQVITIEAVGFIGVLARRRLRKPWADYNWKRWKLLDNYTDPNDATTRDGRERNLHMWYATNESETEVIYSPKGDNYSFVTTDVYALQYTVPAGEQIRWVNYTVKSYRTGEGWNVALKDNDGGTYVHDNNWTNVSVQEPGSVITETWAAGSGPASVTLAIYPGTADTYDIDDFITLKDLQVGTEIETTASADAVIQDVLVKLASSEISSDYGDIGDPNFDIYPFETQGLGFETGDSIIRRAAQYGDGSGNTWAFSVWDETGASDGLAKATFEQFPVATDYEYSMSLDDLARFNGSTEVVRGHLSNYVIVKYTDERGETLYLTPDTDSSLKDQTSIDRWGRYDSPVLNIGQSDSTSALEYGERYLAFHKDPLPSAELIVNWEIKTKAGIWVPAGWVRAGERVQLRGWPTPQEDSVYVIRETDYNADTGELRMQPGEPMLDLEGVLARRDKLAER